MNEGKSQYAVLLKRQEDLKTPEIAQVVAKFRKIPVQDVIGSVKSCWGIVQEGAEEGPAKALAARLEEAGLGVVAVPSGLLEELPPARMIRRIKLEADAFEACCVPGGVARESLFPGDVSAGEPERWERFVWNKVRLVAVAGFKQIVSKTTAAPQGPGLGQRMLKLGIMMTTGLPVSIGPKKQAAAKMIETSDLVFYLDLILSEPTQRLRIDAQNFDYSCLKGRMEYHVLANFKFLTGDISQKAASALRNRGARILNEGKPVREMGYDSLSDLERETRWLMTLRSLKLA